MARPQKKGLDYFPMDVDIFDDIKLKIVRAKYGSDGVMLYFYFVRSIKTDITSFATMISGMSFPQIWE